MIRYFFQGEEDMIAEEIGGRIFWYRPTAEIAKRVQTAGELQVKDSDGGRQSADDFWRLAGDLSWDSSRIGRQPRPLVRPLAEVPS